MSQEQLNGTQASAVFELVGSETMSQGVGMDSILKAGELGGLLAGIPHGLGVMG
jgi:hypothetical protein